ncbi:MAG: hypothetical protein ACF8K1_09900 [Phycisphaerales bacterium JB047]
MTTTPESQALPSVTTSLSPEEVKGRLTKLSKKGKLAGFEPSEPSALCSVAAHGVPFDSKLLIRHGGASLSFECVLLPMLPRIFVLLLIVTIWPGLPLTDGFLSSFDWYTGLMGSIGIDTWHWYLPLTILPAPFAYRSSMKKSKQSAHESALEAIEKVRSVL